MQACCLSCSLHMLQRHSTSLRKAIATLSSSRSGSGVWSAYAPPPTHAHRTEARRQGRVLCHSEGAAGAERGSAGRRHHQCPGLQPTARQQREAFSCRAHRAEPPAMTEVEIKLRLADKIAHATVVAALDPPKVEYAQENYFFDGVNDELRKVENLRIRFYDDDQKAVVTIKGRQELVGGVGRATEVEEDIDPALARAAVQEPDKLLSAGSSLIDDLLSKHGITKLKCLGGFKNNRKVYEWKGETIELDETMYDWGTCYEIELETEHPEKIQKDLEEFLKSHGVDFSYSKRTKFANFRHGTLL